MRLIDHNEVSDTSVVGFTADQFSVDQFAKAPLHGSNAYTEFRCDGLVGLVVRSVAATKRIHIRIQHFVQWR